MVLSVATKVFMPEIELANRYGSLARVARRHLIDLSPQAWKASCRMGETTASRGALGTFRISFEHGGGTATRGRRPEGPIDIAS
jgi:hypothetical protein